MNDWMAQTRIKKNLSQQALSEKVGVSREYISMIENGERTPSVDVAKKIAQELGVSWVIFFN